MNYAIKAVLASREHPGYGVVTVFFPIPREDYDRTIDLLEGLGIGDLVDQDCLVNALDSSYTILKRLENTSVSVDELDYLAKRIDSFCDREATQFQAMAHKLDVSNIMDFIDLTFCCQQATVITDFSDLEQIGKNHSLIINGGLIPSAEYDQVDGHAVALDLIQSGTGTAGCMEGRSAAGPAPRTTASRWRQTATSTACGATPLRVITSATFRASTNRRRSRTLT